MPLVPAVSESEQSTLLWEREENGEALKTAAPPVPRGDSRMRSLLGTTLHVYEIQSLLGHGGMGWVFLARHSDLHRSCAVKLLSPELAAEDVEFVERFQNEGRAAAALVHPNIVTTHAIGRTGEWDYLEMEFVRGRSLQQRISEGALAPLHALSVASQVAAGLAAAHQEGIIHRDLKPDNILLTHRGVPKISDFGLAKRIAQRGDRRLAGTPHFMAPELFHGEEPTPASDVYALGVCLYLMLTRKYPFTRPKLSELMLAVCNDPLPHIRADHPHIPLEVAECVYAMLARTPQNRPRDGIEAHQLLQAILGHARDIESLLHEALDAMPTISWCRENGGGAADDPGAAPRYVARVELNDDRTQRVYIETTSHAGPDRLLCIYSVCGRATEGLYAEALRLNSTIVHGALAIRELEGMPCFVMLNNYPRSTVDAEEIRRSVLDAALHADALERRLSDRDEH
jgi:serine/threonine-protein kinase